MEIDRSRWRYLKGRAAVIIVIKLSKSLIIHKGLWKTTRGKIQGPFEIHYSAGGNRREGNIAFQFSKRRWFRWRSGKSWRECTEDWTHSKWEELLLHLVNELR